MALTYYSRETAPPAGGAPVETVREWYTGYEKERSAVLADLRTVILMAAAGCAALSIAGKITEEEQAQTYSGMLQLASLFPPREAEQLRAIADAITNYGAE